MFRPFFLIIKLLILSITITVLCAGKVISHKVSAYSFLRMAIVAAGLVLSDSFRVYIALFLQLILYWIRHSDSVL